jgi:hypothetical protein
MKKLLLAMLVAASLSAHPECCQTIDLVNVQACISARLEQGEALELVIADLLEKLNAVEAEVSAEELAQIKEYLESQVRCNVECTECTCTEEAQQ